jgi:hypothetical protein
VISVGETNVIPWRLLAVALGIVALVGAAGCGGGAGEKTSSGTGAGTAGATGPSGSSTSAQPAAKVDAAVQANAICARRNRELKATVPPHASLPKVVASAAGRAAIERRALSELNELVPPASTAGAWKAAKAAIEAELQGTLALARLAGASDSASLRRERALLDKPQLRLLVAASHAGLKECGVVTRPSVLGL